jgi:hypothetical protein
VFNRSSASAISSSSSHFKPFANLSLCAAYPNRSAARLLPLDLDDDDADEDAFLASPSSKCAYRAPPLSPPVAPNRAHIFSRSSAAFLGSLAPALLYPIVFSALSGVAVKSLALVRRRAGAARVPSPPLVVASPRPVPSTFRRARAARRRSPLALALSVLVASVPSSPSRASSPVRRRRPVAATRPPRPFPRAVVVATPRRAPSRDAATRMSTSFASHARRVARSRRRVSPRASTRRAVAGGFESDLNPCCEQVSNA